MFLLHEVLEPKLEGYADYGGHLLQLQLIDSMCLEDLEFLVDIVEDEKRGDALHPAAQNRQV